MKIKDILNINNIIINSNVKNIEEAIDLTGVLLLKSGYITEDYIKDMHKKEKVYPSYIGYRMSIPHGFSHSENFVKKSGIAILQSRRGIKSHNGETINLIIAIAGKNDEHVAVLGKVALVCSEEENISKLINAETPKEIIEIFNQELE